MDLHVVIGSSVESRVPAEVLEHSIRSRTKLKIQFHRTQDHFDLPPGHEMRKLTGFSCGRFMAPEIVRQAGGTVGLYLDSDMVVYRDLVELLFYAPKAPHVISRPLNQTAVMLFDASRITWTWASVLEGWKKKDWGYHQLLSNLACEDPKRIRCGIPLAWNSLDQWASDTCLLHYTDMRRQPWKVIGHPFAHKWYEELARFSKWDYTVTKRIDEDVAAGYLGQHLRGYRAKV